MSSLHPQIPFSFTLHEAFTFDNFMVGANQVVVEELQRQLSAGGDLRHITDNGEIL